MHAPHSRGGKFSTTCFFCYFFKSRAGFSAVRTTLAANAMGLLVPDMWQEVI